MRRWFESNLADYLDFVATVAEWHAHGRLPCLWGFESLLSYFIGAAVWDRFWICNSESGDRYPGAPLRRSGEKRGNIEDMDQDINERITKMEEIIKQQGKEIKANEMSIFKMKSRISFLEDTVNRLKKA